MFWLQPTFLILILVGALVIFGTTYMPEFRLWLGRSLNEIKHATSVRADRENPGDENT